MALSIRARVAAGFAFALLLLALVGAAAYRGASATIADIASLRVARASLDATRELRERMLNVETGARGFVITGREDFLAPRDSALPVLPPLLRRLRDLAAPDPARLARLDALQDLIGARLGFDTQTIAVRRARGASAAAALVATRRGKTLMDSIRAQLGAFESDVASDRTRRTAVLQAEAETTRVLAPLAGLLGIVALAVALWSILRALGARERAEARVRDLAAELQDLYDHAPVGYHSLDAQGTFVRMNQTELRWLGYTRGELVGRMRFADLLAAESRPGFAINFENFKRSGEATAVEYNLFRKDGTILPIAISATTVRDAAGGYVMSRGVSVDLTERRRMEAQVKTLRGLLPICASCKKIRDDRGYWNQIEVYVRDHSEAEFSHGLCPECMAKLFPEVVSPPERGPGPS